MDFQELETPILDYFERHTKQLTKRCWLDILEVLISECRGQEFEKV